MGELMNCGVLRACGRPREWMSLLCFDEMIMKSNKANGFTSRGEKTAATKPPISISLIIKEMRVGVELVCWIVFFFLARRAWARLFSLRLLVACLWVGYGWGPGPKATSPKRRQAQPVNQRNEKKTAIEVKWTNQINLSGSLFHGRKDNWIDLFWNEKRKRIDLDLWMEPAPSSQKLRGKPRGQQHQLLFFWLWLGKPKKTKSWVGLRGESWCC